MNTRRTENPTDTRQAEAATGSRSNEETPATLSVVVCSYTLDRWDDLTAALDSLAAQRRRPDETVVVVDHCPELTARLAARPELRVVESTEPPGVSGARNTGVREAEGEVLAFLDDDAVARPDWTEALLDGYRDPAVLGVGGRVDSWWETGRPGWFPPEYDWVVGCSYPGAPEDTGAVRNFIGANMSFRRAAVVAAGGFRSDLGRIGTSPFGCEETELCVRLTALNPGGVLRHQPTAVVRQHVPPARTGWRYFSSRCWAEGRSKAVVARHVGARSALSSERRYVRRTLPLAVLRAVRQGRLRAAGALGAGACLAAAGYATGRLHGPDGAAPDSALPEASAAAARTDTATGAAAGTVAPDAGAGTRP
ncbi:glycosyltransferase family 2 protein [Kitasatospora purpeofusca]|uniref:glycosyltransferase family 2 protein n=1 Tax=Kitasatospora purpeofusca TaxID=67352 RepID=UPI00368210C7